MADAHRRKDIVQSARLENAGARRERLGQHPQPFFLAPSSALFRAREFRLRQRCSQVT